MKTAATSTKSSVHETRDNLLDEIRNAQNKRLRPTQTKEQPSKKKSGNSFIDDLREIQSNKAAGIEGQAQKVAVEKVKQEATHSSPAPTHSVGKESLDSSMPAWKRAMLERKMNKNKEQEEEPEEAPPPVILDKDGKPLPSWKRAVIVMKKDKIEQEIINKIKAEEAKEAKYTGMPDWKKKFLKERHAMQAKLTQVELERERELKQKLAEIAAMPEWKRDLFLKKHPEYKEHM